MKRLMARLRAILWESDTDLAELFDACLPVLWGLWLLAPWRSFDSSTVFKTLAGLAEEWVWGSAYLVFGAAHLAAVLHGSRTWRRAMAYLNMAAWAVLTATYAMGNLHSTAVVIYAALAVAGSWLCVRLGQGVRE